MKQSIIFQLSAVNLVGVANEMETYLDGLLDIEGILVLTDKTLDSKIDKLQDKIVREDDKIDVIRASMTKRFANLESMVSQFENTQEYLKTQLDNILNMGASKK